MAEALVSIILQQLASVSREGIRLIACAEDELEKLTGTFQAIQAVVNDAEKKQVKEDTVRLWLDKLQDTSYDIDDVLDEWNTMIGKSRIKEVEITSKLARKVLSLIPCNIFSCMRFNLRYEIAIKIKNLNRKLDVIALEKDRFNFSLSKGPENLEREMTTSDIDVSEVYGRDHDKSQLVSMLLSESSQGPNLPIRIISVVGVGGIGKTTLAQVAFNAPQLVAHFEKRIWVCVSNPFDEIRIAKAILESLEVDTRSVGELETLLRKVRQSLQDKKFLLVLDDVWIEDPKYWNKLKNSLKCGSQGSRILVTTRKELTAKEMGTTSFFSLGKLSDQESWSLFRKIALSESAGEELEKLEPIGRKVVDKCKGLPLAIKTLGSLLRFKTNIEEWERVLGSELWELEEIEKRLFPPLLLSYYDLSFLLRKCFSYCAIFPKDYIIEKDQLIKSWMAQGYLKVERSLDIELVGERYYKELAMRSFFQDFRMKYDNSTETCKMHDIVHDFAQFLSRNECFTIESYDNNVESQLQCSYKKARHLMVMGDTIPISAYDENKLRSFIVNIDGYDLEKVDLPKLFDQLTCLRTLNLSHCGIKEIPGGIKKLLHLRYLNLSQNSSLKDLPETLYNLYNLQTLDLYRCDSLKKLPEGIDKLINLRHLLNDATYSLRYMPRGMEKMSNLRTLDKLVIRSDSRGSNKAYSLEFLKNLNNRRGSFVLEGLGNVSEVKAMEFKSVKNLLDLRLSFDKVDVKRSMNEENEAILEALQPSPNLVKLRIEHYEGKTLFPVWMVSLTNLRELTLFNCMNCEYLPPLGKLSALESLRIYYLKSVKRVGNEFLGIMNGGTALLKLKTLEFWIMDEWEEWDIKKRENEDITVLPCLQSLSIEDCNKLKGLPDHILQLTTLRELEIRSCDILNSDKLGIFSHRDRVNTIFPNLKELTLQWSNTCESLPPLGNLLSLESLKIWGMKNVKQVGNEILGIELELESGGTIISSIIVFPNLKHLYFEDMKEWEEWDIKKRENEDITFMPCLQSLIIRFCPKLKAVPDQILRKPTLQKLDIYGCPILERRYRKEGMEWWKISHIPKIYIDNPQHPIDDDSESSSSSVVAHSAKDNNQGGEIDSE